MSLLWKHDRHVPGPSSLFNYLLFTGLSTHMTHNGLRGPTPVYFCCLVNVALSQFYSENIGTFGVSGPCFENMFRSKVVIIKLRNRLSEANKLKERSFHS